MTTRRPSSLLENVLLNRRPGSDAPSPRYSVVVIDDDKRMRDSLSFVLGERYELTLCATAKEGVDAVNEDTCAVILDVRMPEQDGFWACTEIRKKNADLPVIFFSAYQDVKDPYEIINEHRPFAYIIKGDDHTKIVEVVGLAVKLQSMAMYNRQLLDQMQDTPDPVR
jgi:DNA-binding NtrC family response regulator